MRSAWHLFLALVAARQASSDQLVDPTSKDNAPDCDCFVASGPDPGFFQYHRFWDFRSIPNDGDNSYTSAPALITADQSNGAEPVTSSYLSSAKFKADWTIYGTTERLKSPFRTVYSPQNIYISRNTTDGANNSTYLTLRASRLPDFMSTAQMDSMQNNILYGSFRSRFRVIPNGLSNSSAPSAGNTAVDDSDVGSSAQKPVDDGAVVGFFTYFNDTEETDIEILTKEPTNLVHYTNQPDYDEVADMEIPDASTNTSILDGLAATDWIEHRIDYFEGVTRYYVNGKLALNKTKNAPSTPMGLIFNLWGDGGSWSGNMSMGGQVTMAVEWAEMIFNVSGDIRSKSSSKRDQDGLGLFGRDAGSCNAACAIDNVKTVGFPEKTSLATRSQPSSSLAAGSSASATGSSASAPGSSASSAGSSDGSSTTSTKSAGVILTENFGSAVVVLFGVLAVAAPTMLFV